MVGCRVAEQSRCQGTPAKTAVVKVVCRQEGARRGRWGSKMLLSSHGMSAVTPAGGGGVVISRTGGQVVVGVCWATAMATTGKRCVCGKGKKCRHGS